MKLDLDTKLVNAKGEPFTAIGVEAGSLWWRFNKLHDEGKALADAIDTIGKEIGGKDLLVPMDLGMVFWRAVDGSPKHGSGTPSEKRDLAKLSYKLTKAGEVEFTDAEVKLLLGEIERFHGAMIVAVEDVIDKAKAAEAAEREKTAEAAKLVAVEGTG